MSFKLCLMLVSTLFSTYSFAQMTGASIFPEMRTSNPAVLSSRPAAVLSFFGKKDNVVKNQDLSQTSFGAGTESSTKVDVQTLSIFYGGKGGGITSEIILDMGTGKKTNEFVRTTGTEEVEDNVEQTLFRYGISLGDNFGITIQNINFDYDSNYNFSGTPAFKVESNTNATFYKAGFKFNLGVDLGLYYEGGSGEQAQSVDGTKSESNIDFSRVGVGVGSNAKNFRVELAFEKDLEEEKFDNKVYNPTKISFSIEMKFANFAIGYTGAQLNEGFTDFDQLLYNNMVYASSQEESRLVNTFNFSFGSTKGHYFSGSVGFSQITVDEGNDLFNDGNKYETEITAMGVSVKYGYAF